MMLARLLQVGLVCVCALSTSAQALSLSPALFMVQNVKPGEALDVRKAAGVTFKVTNDTDAPGIFNLKCKQPSKGGLLDWEKGYDEIPDPSWAKLEKEEFEIPAKSTIEVGLTILIPDKPENYNGKWVLAVVLSAGKAKLIGVGLSLAARVQIETLPNPNDNTGGSVSLAPIPGLLQVSSRPGEPFVQLLKVKNYTNRQLDCKAGRLIDVYSDETKYARYVSGGYLSLLKEGWISPRAEDVNFSLKPGEVHEFKISGKIPATAKPGEKYEELIFITAPPAEPGAKTPAGRETQTFFRVQYHILGENK